MKNPKISVDFDGCLARTSDFICELVNFKTGKNFNSKQIDCWEFWTKAGLEKEFWESYNFMDRNGRMSLKPYDSHVFDSLQKLGMKFDIVTANKKCAKKQINKWLYDYGNLTPSVFCIGRKNLAEKLSLDYEIYIDDNPNLAAEIINFPNKFLLLANAPWNKKIKNSKNVRRFESWKEVPGLIREIQNN